MTISGDSSARARRAAARSAPVAVLVLVLVLMAGVLGAAGLGAPAAAFPRGDDAAASDVDTAAVPPIRLPRNWQRRFDTRDRSIGLLRASVAAARAGHRVPSRLSPTLGDVDDSFGRMSPCNYAIDSVRRLCPRGDRRARRTIVLYGNSHGRHWINAVESIAKRRHYRVYFLTKPSCLGSLVTPVYGNDVFEGCAEFHRFALRSIARLDPVLTIVSSSSTRAAVRDNRGRIYRANDAVRRAVSRGNVQLFRALKRRSERVAVLQDIPHLKRSAPDCLRGGGSLAGCLSRTRPDINRDMREQLAAATRARVQVVRTWQWFCWQGLCPAVVGGFLPYRDDEHQTNPYSASLAGSLAARIGGL